MQDGLVLWLDARAQRQLIKMGQSDSVWKDLSGNGNDCEVHREVFEYPPILEGGRNLLKDSKSLFLTGTDYSDHTIREVVNNEYGRIEVIKEGTWNSYNWAHNLLTNKEIFSDSNSKYTLSLDVRTTRENIATLQFNIRLQPGHANIYRSDSIKIPNTNGKWERVFVTMTTPNDQLERNALLIIFNAFESVVGDVIEYRNIKLEKGSQATPWTPAPEDLGLEYPDWVQNFHPGLKDRWYENKLHFINSDSHIRIPEINLNPDNFTIQVDNRIRVFNGDKVITENGDEWGSNLIPNTSDKNKTVSWNGWDYNLINVPHIEDIGLSVGDSLVFRLYIEETNEPVRAFAQFRLNDGSGNRYRQKSGNIIYEGESGWSEVKFTISEEDVRDLQQFTVAIRNINASNATVTYRKAKLEKGLVATPWTPAPEDVTKINIINRNTPFVENNTIYTLRFYNRALTDEEILQNYRAIHFLLEPKTFTSNDYYNYYDLNRVEINTLATKDLTEVLRGDINLEDIDFERDMKSIPFADVLNKIEKNINALGNKLYKPKGWTQPKLDWTYNQPFSYVDANRLERNLLLLYNFAKGNIDNIPHCGMYICGEEVV